MLMFFLGSCFIFLGVGFQVVFGYVYFKVIFEGVRVGCVYAQGQFQQRFQAGGCDVIYWFFQFFFSEVYEVYEEVFLVYQEVAFDGFVRAAKARSRRQ